MKKLLLIFTALASTVALGQVTIDKLPQATLPLSGTENVAISQGGLTRKTALSQVPPLLANPTATVGPTVTNGVATSAMPSDAAPAICLTCSFTWAGNHIFSPSGGTTTFNATSGAPVQIKGFNGASGGALQLLGQFTGAGNIGLLQISDAGNTNGANILLTGNGGVTPKKYIRVVGGVLQFLNDAYNAQLLSITDGGLITAPTIYNSASWVQGPSSTAQTAALSVSITPTEQQNGTTSNSTTALMSRWSADALGPFMYIGKSRGATVGTRSSVINNDQLGTLAFGGDDGATNIFEAAQISVQVNGTPAAGSIPGQIVFSTTAAGNATPTARMTLNSAGNVQVNSPVSGPAVTIQATTTANALILTATGNATNGSLNFNFDGSGNVFAYNGTANTVLFLGSTQSGTTVEFVTNNINRGSINGTGNWVIPAPASGTAVSVTGVSGQLAVSATQPVGLPAFTVSTLPACNATLKGGLAYVTDATAPTYNAALTGGGAVVIPVFCNGTAWTAH